jgi:hypothetical protein
MDCGGSGPRWSKDRGGGRGSPELLLPAGMGHSSSPRYGQNGEGSATVLRGCSLELGRR